MTTYTHTHTHPHTRYLLNIHTMCVYSNVLRERTMGMRKGEGGEEKERSGKCIVRIQRLGHSV